MLPIKSAIKDIVSADDKPLELSIKESCVKHNVTIDSLIQCLGEGMRASKTKTNPYGDEVEEVDYNVRSKYLIIGMQLLNMIDSKNDTSPSSVGQMNIFVNTKDIEDRIRTLKGVVDVNSNVQKI